MDSVLEPSIRPCAAQVYGAMNSVPCVCAYHIHLCAVRPQMITRMPIWDISSSLFMTTLERCGMEDVQFSRLKFVYYVSIAKNDASTSIPDDTSILAG